MGDALEGGPPGSLLEERFVFAGPASGLVLFRVGIEHGGDAACAAGGLVVTLGGAGRGEATEGLGLSLAGPWVAGEVVDGLLEGVDRLVRLGRPEVGLAESDEGPRELGLALVFAHGPEAEDEAAGRPDLPFPDAETGIEAGVGAGLFEEERVPAVARDGAAERAQHVGGGVAAGALLGAEERGEEVGGGQGAGGDEEEGSAGGGRPAVGEPEGEGVGLPGDEARLLPGSHLGELARVDVGELGLGQLGHLLPQRPQLVASLGEEGDAREGLEDLLGVPARGQHHLGIGIRDDDLHGSEPGELGRSRRKAIGGPALARLIGQGAVEIEDGRPGGFVLAGSEDLPPFAVHVHDPVVRREVLEARGLVAAGAPRLEDQVHGGDVVLVLEGPLDLRAARSEGYSREEDAEAPSPGQRVHSCFDHAVIDEQDACRRDEGFIIRYKLWERDWTSGTRFAPRLDPRRFRFRFARASSASMPSRHEARSVGSSRAARLEEIVMNGTRGAAVPDDRPPVPNLLLVAMLAGLVAAAFLPTDVFAATIAVNADADDFDAGPNGNCTLREAILAANTNLAVDGCPAGEAGPGVVDRIVVPAGTYVLSVGPMGDSAGESGDLDLTDEVEIDGAGADLTTVDAAGLDRVFQISSGVEVTLVGLKVTGGAGASPGGGILNNGTLTVLRSWVDGNTAEGLGGGIRNDATLVIEASTLTGNSASNGGHGGGIDNHGVATLTNVTVSGNQADTEGGGLYVRGGDSLTLIHSTVTANTAPTSDAIHNSGSLTLTGSVIVGACRSAATSGGGNLESPGDTCGLGSGDLASVADPMLGVLGVHGGPTPTIPVLAGSPAVDFALVGTCPPRDQRGGPRPVDGDGDLMADCDAGAIELGADLSGQVFTDDFETGDTSAWTTVVP